MLIEYVEEAEGAVSYLMFRVWFISLVLFFIGKRWSLTDVGSAQKVRELEM